MLKSRHFHRMTLTPCSLANFRLNLEVVNQSLAASRTQTHAIASGKATSRRAASTSGIPGPVSSKVSLRPDLVSSMILIENHERPTGSEGPNAGDKYTYLSIKNWE
jgi:hypothetical protein